MRKKVRRLRRVGRERRERRGEREVRQALGSIDKRLRRLGYTEAAADHVSRLHLPSEILDFLMQLGYTTIGSLQVAVLTRTGFFRVGQRSRFQERVLEEVLEALIEFHVTSLRFLREAWRRLAKD